MSTADVALFVRVFTFVCVLISIGFIATNNPQVDGGKIKIKGFSAYSYTSALGIIGVLFAYLIFQTSAIFVCTGDGQGAVLFWRFFISTSGVALDITQAVGSERVQGLSKVSNKLIGH